MKIFDGIQVTKPKRNSFDLSHEKKLSMNMGDLVPIFHQEVVPGDTFSVSSEQFMRLAPMVAPMMHRVNAYTHFFFVPNRLIWNEWEDFITGGEDGQLTPAFPQVELTGTKYVDFKYGKLADYLGLGIVPKSAGDNEVLGIRHFSALPFRAYAMIYNEYYRDQNLEQPIAFGIGSGIQDAVEQNQIMTMRKRAWEKDYFTSALPWAQRGGDVNLPIESTAEFIPQYKAISDVITSNATTLPLNLADDLTNNKADLGVSTSVTEAGSASIENLIDPHPVDVTSTSVTIAELRKAVRLQEWLEKNARGGSRYIEQIFVHFGVKSSDARLQRPEYLGGGRQPIVISEVLQTSASGSDVQQMDTPQGNMAGHGISVGKSNKFTRSFEEHGIILGICSVLPRTTYQQGVERHWTKFDKFDYYWPEFAHIGEQEVVNKEIYLDPLLDPTTSTEEDTFGYQSRYAEYRYKQSTVHGDFRDELSFWHMGRIFDSAPVLNETFVQSDPTHRVFAVIDPAVTKLYVQIYNKVRALRPIPYYTNPRL